jgi:hypothetical protein
LKRCIEVDILGVEAGEFTEPQPGVGEDEDDITPIAAYRLFNFKGAVVISLS